LSDHHQGALSLAKVILQYSQFNSYLQTKRCGSISCVGMCCGAVAQQLHNTFPHNKICCHNTVCKYELNYEYCNITLAKDKAPWWWSDKIETCRSVLNVLKCFKSVLCEIIYASLVDRLKWFALNFAYSSVLFDRYRPYSDPTTTYPLTQLHSQDQVQGKQLNPKDEEHSCDEDSGSKIFLHIIS